jgi:TRAP-type C4-dicarboxylate transport system permease large subunit
VARPFLFLSNVVQLLLSKLVLGGSGFISPTPTGAASTATFLVIIITSFHSAGSTANGTGTATACNYSHATDTGFVLMLAKACCLTADPFSDVLGQVCDKPEHLMGKHDHYRDKQDNEGYLRNGT